MRLWKDRSLDRSLVPNDLRITDSRYGITLSLWCCQACGFIQAEGNELVELIRLYEQLSDPEYQEGESTRRLQMRWLLEGGLKANPSAKTLLDIGAGTGLLLAEAKARGLDALGIEPSRALGEMARRLNGVDVLEGTIPHPDLESRRFDLVYLVDVIEHVAEPVRLLRDCAGMLTPAGVLVVVTPDVTSLAARLLGKLWWHFRLAHVGYFSPRSMKVAVNAAGLHVIKSFRATWFFPVHYLTERLGVYLPLATFNELAPRLPFFNWLYQRTVRLNLRDSIVFVMKANT